MKIVLVGYMGVGKSRIGKLLAKKMQLPFYDLDKEIIKLTVQSINNIFKEKGELYFRTIENELLEKYLKKESYILSVGGGTPMYYNNMDLINVNSKSIYLKTNIDHLTQRLFNKRSDRPLISHLNSKNELKEFIAKHLFERKTQYEKAQHIIDVTDKNKKEIVDELKIIFKSF